MTKVINLYAGPGTGKSTTATALQAELKYRGINSEYVPEFAKDGAWEGRPAKFFQAQQYIWGEQSWRMDRLRNEVDIIVTDCPLLMGLVYIGSNYRIPALVDAIRQDFHSYDNMNVFLKRNKPYNPKGRNQTEDEAKLLDTAILLMLENETEIFHGVSFSRLNTQEILTMADQCWPELKLS